MIVPIAMIKRYQHSRFFRILWIVLFPFTLGIGGTVWAIWPETGRGWLFAVEVLIGFYALYALWSLLGTFVQVTLSPSDVTIAQFGRTIQLRYDTIESVKRGEVALVIKSQKRTVWIERHIDDVFDLMGELRHRAPALRVEQQALIRQPLPQTVNGRFRAFLFGLGISLLTLAVGGGIIWSALDETGFAFAGRLFFGLWPLFISGTFFYLSFYFTWRLTLLPDRIVIQHPLHKREFLLENLYAARLVAIRSSRPSVEDSVVLVLSLINGRSLRITQQEMPIPLAQLLEMMVYHYQLPLTFEKEPVAVHHTQFGAGSRRPFSHYLEGKSRVSVQSVEDICRWLQQCDYVSDTELFNQRDVWQHPGEFEKLKKGDCEDHALWAWRKLKELNIPAEFVVGRMRWGDSRNGASQSAHAWVAFQENGRRFILETTQKRQLVYPLEEIQERYHPWFSVDAEMQTYKFMPIAGEKNGMHEA